MSYERITVHPDQMGALPCIRGLRIPIATVVAMVADGMTEAEILQALPDLEPADIRQALRCRPSNVLLCQPPVSKPCSLTISAARRSLVSDSVRDSRYDRQWATGSTRLKPSRRRTREVTRECQAGSAALAWAS